jgi:Tfp pilus assembly protein PilF
MKKTMPNKNEYLNEGFRFFTEQNYQQAVEQFNNAIELDPKFDLAINALAETYNKMGDLDKAIEMARKLIQINPNDPLAHTALSRLFVQKGMIAEAEKEMAISNQLSSENS